MSRPETVDDLTADQRRGPEFASFDLGAFPIDGELLRAAAKFLDHCVQPTVTSIEVAQVGTRVNFYATPTDADLQANLETAQRSWDVMHGRYLAALSGEPRGNFGNFAYSIEQWCAREGLDLPWNEPAVTE